MGVVVVYVEFTYRPVQGYAESAAVPAYDDFWRSGRHRHLW